MAYYYIDSHAHLSSSPAFEEIHSLLDKAQREGIQAIINICTDVESLKKGLSLSQKYPWIYNTASTTPHDVEKYGERDFTTIAQHARQGDLIAIGETGLDYHYEHSSREVQKHFLRKYILLAKECQLPIVIHCREAFSDFFEIIDSDYLNEGKHLPGVLHCFTGTLTEAEEVIKRGWFLSLSGIVTFKKSIELQEVAKRVPLNQLLVETDTPYLAPQSKRGKPNEPSFLPEIVAKIAEMKGVTIEKVATATFLNARTLFNLKI